jgi:DNA-binding LacI/PurR family transcriptional regulator
VAIPGALSVVGFDDIPSSSYTVPPLTTIHMPVSEMTSVAARLAMDEPEDGATPVDNVILSPSLVVRKSTGPAPG